MKERPIIFSAESVRGILAGTKTQTRRAIQALPNGLPPRCYVGRNEERWTFTGGDRAGDAHGLLCPYGAPMDRLWVRETWASDDAADDAPPKVLSATSRVWYAAASNSTSMVARGRWRSPIHMPRWASRLTLEVTEVRVERLQSITEADAKAEGVQPFFERFPSVGRDQRLTSGDLAAERPHRASYAVAWDEINGDRLVGGQPIRWIENPWIWAVTFRTVPTGQGGGAS